GTTVTGTYQWNATYSGDKNNNAASDVGAANERVTVSKASPALVTTASPDVTLPTGPPDTVTLSDSADLEGGYFPTGSIVFTLTGPGGFSFTQTVTVSGDGPYTASVTLPSTPPWGRWPAGIPGRPTISATATTTPPTTRAASPSRPWSARPAPRSPP